MAPVRLRSRIAGLLRRAAHRLDRSPSTTPPAVSPQVRQPGEPPEHWLRLVRERAPGLLAGEGIGTVSRGPAARLGRAADPASLRWPADPRPTRPAASFPSRSSSPAPASLRVPAPSAARRTGVTAPVEARRAGRARRRIRVPGAAAPRPVAVPRFPVDRTARVVVPRFPLDRRGRFVVPDFPLDAREPLPAPEFRAEETVAVDAPEFPAHVPAARTVAAPAFPSERHGTAVRPGYPTVPAPVPAIGREWSSPAPARVAAAPEWPRLPRPHGGTAPAWPHPDPDPSRWPALPDDSPLWTVPGPSIDERRVRRLDAEQAGR